MEFPIELIWGVELCISDAYNRGPPDESVSLGPPPGLEPVRRLLTESEAVQRAPKRGESAQRPFRSRIPSQRLSQREEPVLRPTEEGPTDQIPPREGESFNRHPGRVENSFRESQETQRPSRGQILCLNRLISSLLCSQFLSKRICKWCLQHYVYPYYHRASLFLSKFEYKWN